MMSQSRPRARFVESRPGRCLLALLVLGAAAAARGASGSWKATPVDANWSNGANWSYGHAPNPGDDLTFPATSTILATNNDLSSGISISSITFSGAGYTLSGNAITIGEILCSSTVVGSNTIGLPMTVNTTIVVGTAAGCSLDLTGVISGSGGILATGGGPVILDGDDTYTGVTKAGATGGNLVINGTLSGTSSVVVQESSGNPTLGGHGSFTAPLTVDNAFPIDTAYLSPGQGTSTGALGTGNLILGSSGQRNFLVVKLKSTTAGTGYDQIVAGGTVALTHASLNVSLGFTPSNGDQFTIIKNNGPGAVSGTFIGLAEGAQFVAKDSTSQTFRTFQITYAGGTGHDVVLTVVPTVAAPAALAVDASGNGVLETGETAALDPTWTNLSGGTASLTGTATNFTGPAPASAVFSIVDAAANYGSLANGNSAPCDSTGDCYSIQLTSPTRPAQHWDTQWNETIAPLSIIKTWTLHVGQSFPDVTTSNQFYKFVENLFHNGVTGGCAGGNYCPTNPVTRAQMAVFLLKGEHGGGYTPPSCAATLFTDVPCPGGAFVDWINQLATEGITGGCGGGNYCPGNSVTRGQMAVFLLKGEHGGAYVPPACSATVFADVVCPTAQFVNFINQLAAEGITGGCGGGNYCPAASVNRGQMSAFLVKTFDLILYGP